MKRIIVWSAAIPVVDRSCPPGLQAQPVAIGRKLMSVTGHLTGAFPQSFISSGNGDPLAPQAVAFARKLGGVGVRVETLFFPENHVPRLPHEYQFNLDERDGQEAAKPHGFGRHAERPRAFQPINQQYELSC
jgi:acetyl esterase/lipase